MLVINYGHPVCIKQLNRNNLTQGDFISYVAAGRNERGNQAYGNMQKPHKTMVAVQLFSKKYS